MTKNILATPLTPQTPAGSTIDQPSAYRFEITYSNGSAKSYFIGFNQIQMVLDDTQNYMELKANGMLIYAFEQGDTYNTTPIVDALDIYTILEARFAS
jgi:hypothetical protein